MNTTDTRDPRKEHEMTTTNNTAISSIRTTVSINWESDTDATEADQEAFADRFSETMAGIIAADLGIDADTVEVTGIINASDMDVYGETVVDTSSRWAYDSRPTMIYIDGDDLEEDAFEELADAARSAIADAYSRTWGQM